MKEQSHKDEMSAALRGDFARLRERGVSSTLAPAEQRPQREGLTEPDPEQPAAETPTESPPVVREEPEPPRSGMLGRLFGR